MPRHKRYECAVFAQHKQSANVNDTGDASEASSWLCSTATAAANAELHILYVHVLAKSRRNARNWRGLKGRTFAFMMEKRTCGDNSSDPQNINQAEPPFILRRQSSGDRAEEVTVYSTTQQTSHQQAHATKRPAGKGACQPTTRAGQILNL